MKKQPLVSVIILTYNGERCVSKAIASVCRQNYRNMEIIVINDGSRDGTLAVLAKISKKNPRIKILNNKANLGFVKTLNRGVKTARGKYIARLDDDDYWIDKKKIKKQVEFLEKNSDYALVGGGMVKISGNNKEIGRHLFPEKDEEIRKSILVNNLFAHSAIMARKDAVKKVGGYDERFGFFSDMDLWLKIGKIGKFYNFPEYFVCYFDKEALGDYSGRDKDIRRKLGLCLELRKKYKNDYPGYAKAYLFCLASYVYSFLPLRRKLRLVFLGIKKILTGQRYGDK